MISSCNEQQETLSPSPGHEATHRCHKLAPTLFVGGSARGDCTPDLHGWRCLWQVWRDPSAQTTVAHNHDEGVRPCLPRRRRVRRVAALMYVPWLHFSAHNATLLHATCLRAWAKALMVPAAQTSTTLGEAPCPERQWCCAVPLRRECVCCCALRSLLCVHDHVRLHARVRRRHPVPRWPGACVWMAAVWSLPWPREAMFRSRRRACLSFVRAPSVCHGSCPCCDDRIALLTALASSRASSTG